ncbi:RNA polymerase sigma factor [Brooklawnia cerclae]|uniref:RNA polymerase sigma-70 factor (ECF subfamily) n=1 Tax=Brooklawnia cerclae TaxID=349934 RepID=A0ABX0SC29_9ACTN|nr:sigma-70 family RNA polymerase sigma factor [Brooklawnia cerclae]NIH55939.1 RNA polymerase sigma-70 factor (ECF subfamily) [Brooklawnia cerclae]
MTNPYRDIPEASDAAVIRDSLDDPEQFAIIFERHSSVVHGYLGRRAGSVADDLLGEVFLIAFRKRHTFDPDASSARPWLFGIASNLLARRARAETARYRALARLAVVSADDVDALERSDARIDASAARRAIATGLADLHSRDRDVLLMTAWADMSYADIAEALDIPLGTVRSRLHRARTLMRSHLSGIVISGAMPTDEPSPLAPSRGLIPFATKDES